MDTDGNIVWVDSLSKRYKDTLAVDRLSFTIAPGEIFGLIGANGAGKTTTIAVLLGLVTPTGGQVRIFGTNPAKNRRKVLERMNFSSPYVALPYRLTVLENLMLAPLDQTGERLRPLFSQSEKIRAEERAVHTRALEILDYAKLRHLKDAYARDLSGGQKKLLELARALMIDSEVILLDEPGAGVNPALMSSLVEMIQDLNRTHGKTFLIIEHDMDLVARICEPVIVMTEGRVLTEGPFDEIRRDPLVIEAYLGGARDREVVR